MTLQELHTQLVAKKLQKFYIFTGDEIGIMNIYLNQISKIAGMPIYRADTFSEAYSGMKKQSMFGKNFVYAIRDDKEILENEKAQKLLDTLDVKDIPVFLFISVDKRSKFYKCYKDTLIEFNRLESSNLKRYIKKEIDLSDENCLKLAEICENDYSRIMLEIDKIKQFQNASKDYQWDGVEYISTKDCFKMLVKDGTIYKSPKDAIFDWVDAMMLCSKKAFELYNQSLLVGEASLPLLSVLYNNVKQTFQVQTCTSNDVCKSTGLTNWQIQCAKKYVGRYTDKELMEYMEIIRAMETGIKTGAVDDAFTVPYVMTKMLGGYR